MHLFVRSYTSFYNCRKFGIMKFHDFCKATYGNLSYDIAVIQWLISCYKNCMTIRYVNTWLLAHNVMFSFEAKSTFKATEFHLKQSHVYDKQNLTLVVISYEIYEAHAEGSFQYEMTTRVRSSMLYIYGENWATALVRFVSSFLGHSSNSPVKRWLTFLK